MTPQEFPKGKEEYCPRCYFEDEVTILRENCPHLTTNQDKYQKIMEVMSDKTLSFGCKIIVNNPYKWDIVMDYAYGDHTEDSWYIIVSNSTLWYKILLKEIKEIIWHPLHIWDVLYWMDNNYDIPDDELRIFLNLWKDKRLPLAPTDIELVDYIYSLIA